MMKKGKDKSVRSEALSNKAMPESESKPVAAGCDPSVQELVCIQECNVPGVGTWRNGEKITDPVVIAKISGSPCFKPTQEVE